MAGGEVKGVFRLNSEVELVALQKRMGAGRTHLMEGSNPKNKPKYKNRRVFTEEWGWFDSQKELDRWRELLLLEKAGKIHGLKRQAKFEIAPPCILDGRRKRALKYIADFEYVEAGEKVIEDVKGFKPRLYRLKRHLMKVVHGIEVLET